MSRKKFINAKLKSVNELQEILTDHGVFQEISPRISAPDCEIIDLQGKLILPPYVDPHIHLDYVFTARKQGAANGTGTLFEGIQRWSETKSDLTVDEIKARAIIAVKKETGSRRTVYPYTCRCNRSLPYLSKGHAGITGRA